MAEPQSEYSFSPLLFAMIPIAIVAVAMVQRLSSWTPHWAWLFAVMTVLPYLVALRRVNVPAPITAGLIIAGECGLLLHAPAIDMSPFILVYLAGHAGADWPWRVGAPVTAAAVATVAIPDILGSYQGSPPWIAGILLAFVAGSAVGAQQRTLRELQAAQAGLAAAAAAQERERIAREVHDVIAHSLTVTLLHIGAARMAMEKDPAEAAAALLEAERLGRQSLGEIRQTVGMLRGPSELGAIPTASDIPALVAQFQAAGMKVDFLLEGSLDGLPAALGLGLYRITQESLSNVAKHTDSAPVQLDIAVLEDCVHVSVTDRGGRPAAVGNGLGIGGMKERAAVLGGTCAAGPTADGWAVRVSVPRISAPTP